MHIIPSFGSSRASLLSDLSGTRIFANRLSVPYEGNSGPLSRTKKRTNINTSIHDLGIRSPI